MSFHPNWRTPSFFRGVAKNHQPAIKWCFFWCGVFWYSHFGKVSFILVYMFCWLYFAIIRHWRAFPWSCDSRADPWWNPAYWPSVGTKDLKRTRPSIGRHFNWWFIQFSVIPWFWNDMLIYFEISWYMLIIGKYWGNLVRFAAFTLHPSSSLPTVSGSEVGDGLADQSNLCDSQGGAHHGGGFYHRQRQASGQHSQHTPCASKFKWESALSLKCI